MPWTQVFLLFQAALRPTFCQLDSPGETCSCQPSHSDTVTQESGHWGELAQQVGFLDLYGSEESLQSEMCGCLVISVSTEIQTRV